MKGIKFTGYWHINKIKTFKRIYINYLLNTMYYEKSRKTLFFVFHKIDTLL